ncbi:uncharacterized protein [Asterias amurensis]|uniref:uncharacterized protein isoform X2 n=1 Tax=Asterias amurensis TaxID=7602 RepID=UPI003AB22F93
MEIGNGGSLDSQEKLEKDDKETKSSSESFGEGVVSGTDVDAGVLLSVRRGSVTAAERPRPMTGARGGSSHVGSHSFHFVGSKKQDASFADVGFVRPHHSRADVNISKQGVNEGDEVAIEGNLSTVESSKSDTELLMQETDAEVPNVRLDQLSSEMAKIVTLASASEVVRQSNSCDQVSASHLNKCNSSSQQAHWADSGHNVDLRGQRSNGGIKGKKSSRPVEGKRSSNTMLGRIKNLNCLSSSDDGRSREDLTASSEDVSKTPRSISKIPKKRKTKKKKKQGEGEESEKGNSDEKSSSGTEVGRATAEEEVVGTEKKPKEAEQDVVLGKSNEDVSLPSPPDVLKEIKTGASPVTHQQPTQDDSSSQGTRPSEPILDDSKKNVELSGSSIELLKEYEDHVDDGETVLPAVLTGDQLPSGNIKPTHSVEFDTPPKKKMRADAARDPGVVDHLSTPPMLLHLVEEVLRSKSDIPLKAVRERCRILSQQSGALPGISIDETLRLAVLGSLSFAAERVPGHQEIRRRAASAPGPLEHLSQAFNASEISVDPKIESGISSFDSALNEYTGLLKSKTDSGSSSGITFRQNGDQTTKSSSSDSSQDEFVRRMQRARHSSKYQASPSPTPQQVHFLDNTKKGVTTTGYQDTKGDSIGSMMAASSGYGSSLQAKLTRLETDLSNDKDLGKPYKVDEPLEEDSMRRKELAFILKMLQKDSGGHHQGSDVTMDASPLEAAISYLYWSRHDAQDLLKKPQQHQKVVIEDKLEAQNLQLDLPPHRGNDNLEHLKIELQQRVKQIDDAIAKHEAMANAVTHQQQLESPGPILADLITSSPDSKSSSSSCEDSRPPSSFQCNRSVAYMSPGGALGGGIPSVDECESARRLRRESVEKMMDLSKEKEQMSAQLKEQRLAAVQLEAHLLSQLTTLTKEYQGLMTHDQEQQKIVREYKQKLDKKQKDLDHIEAQLADRGLDTKQVQQELDTISFTFKEKIHQLQTQLAGAERQNLDLQESLGYAGTMLETMKEESKMKDREIVKLREEFMTELKDERSYRSQLDSKLISQSNDIHHMAISLNDLQEENHTQADEMRHLHQALEASHQSQAELQQQLQQSAQRLETENLKWRQQRQQLKEHLNETKACLEKSQLHLKTLSHTNQSLSSTTKQLQTSYKDLSSQLEKEKLAKEMTCQDLERLRKELESERKTRSDQVNAQLSQWQGSLQKSTKKLSAALNNKIQQQQSELQHIRDINTELVAGLQDEHSFTKPTTSGQQSGAQHVQFPEFNSSSQNPLHQKRHQFQRQPPCYSQQSDWTYLNTEGIVPDTRQECGSYQQHRRC